jgi:hypothetical protein
VPRVLHDTDPTTKTGLDQIQNSGQRTLLVEAVQEHTTRLRSARSIGSSPVSSLPKLNDNLDELFTVVG